MKCIMQNKTNPNNQKYIKQNRKQILKRILNHKKESIAIIAMTERKKTHWIRDLP